jgi:hypothetical protein
MISKICWLAVLVPLTIGCSKKPTEVIKKEGWQREEGWNWSCLYPIDFEALGPGDRRISRQKTLEGLMGQWRGDRSDGIKFDSDILMRVETVLLGAPEKIERAAADNLEKCIDSQSSGTTISWGQWLASLPDVYTKGECKSPPLDYTLYDYLNIGSEWHIPAPVCKNDQVVIHASERDYYRVTDDGPWINAAGDPDSPATANLPCNTELCTHGQLIMRFKGESGVETIQPVGLEIRFTAPEHGSIEVMINDDVWYDNAFKIEGGIEHHTSIEYSPAQ